MSIDLYFCRETDGQFELDSEAIAFASVGEFYNLAHMLGPMIELLEEENLPEELTNAMAAFREYINENRSRNEESFAGYLSFMGEVARKFSHTADNPEAIKHIDADPAVFHPAVRAFLGRLILSEEITTPDNANKFAGALGACVGFMNVNLKHYGENEPELARALENAREKAMTIMRYCDRAVNEERCFLFHP